MHDLAKAYRGWINASLKEVKQFRDGKWTESVAVGSKAFVEQTKERLGIKAEGRRVIGEGGRYELRESPVPYRSILGYENEVLRPRNRYSWKYSDLKSIG